MRDLMKFVPPAERPDIFRVTASYFSNCKQGGDHVVRLFHDDREIVVGWHARHINTRLKPDTLVRIRWGRNPGTSGQIIPVSHVYALDHPERSLNLFHTVPKQWVVDRELVSRAAALWDELPTHFQELFNTVFWEGSRFNRYCQGPSSLRGHHAEVNGNLRHSVDAAESALGLARTLAPSAQRPLLILGALLHDAGKADEYVVRSHGDCSLTQRGQLVGHKLTVVEWLAVARNRMRLGIPEDQYLSLIHMITAVAKAPAWTGLKDQRLIEAMLLSRTDRISGQSDLIHSNASRDGGWGQFHPHLGRTFFSPVTGMKRCLPHLDRLIERFNHLDAEGKPITPGTLECQPLNGLPRIVGSLKEKGRGA